MHILLSNDDGYFAPGLAALYEAIKQLPQVKKITVVAPERNQSGVSNALTLSRPLNLRLGFNGFYYVDGTPTDCVHLAVTGLLDELPDMVISGINEGANLGDDTLYSGTVAAATEGLLLGVPSLAISLRNKPCQHYASAAKVACQLVESYCVEPWPPSWLLNVNVPDLPFESIGEMEVCRLGKRHKSEPVVAVKNPHGETLYWVGSAGKTADDGPGTDFFVARAKKISVTPIQVDLTAYDQLDQVKSWLGRR